MEVQEKPRLSRLLDLRHSPTWQALSQHQKNIAPEHMRDWFVQDPSRAERFSCEAAGLYLDYSKNRIKEESLALLLALAQEKQVPKKIQSLFRGDIVNPTENMAALHTALRLPPHGYCLWEGHNVVSGIHQELARMEKLIETLENGQWRGATGKAFTDVVNIGIGGSDLGPKMATDALASYSSSRLKTHFISNVDGADLRPLCEKLNPETTCFIIASKSFKTPETLCNARSAVAWLGSHLSTVAPHLIGITAYPERARIFGVPAEQTLKIWPWVGGRFSLWSTIGFCVALSIGMDNFRSFLAGAYAMDQHVQSAPLSSNMPAILALLEIWYTNFFGAQSVALLPYAQPLQHLPAFLQQLAMESNGKSTTHAGRLVNYATSPVLWGHVGCNGQHAFHQLLHQGTHSIPVDIIVPAKSRYPLGEHHDWLLANALSQAQALMQGLPEEQAHKTIPGNRPSNILLLPEISPHALGALLALYEHKIFIQSAIWDINPFDQYGVELGKHLSAHVLPGLKTGSLNPSLDSSTQTLIQKLRAAKEN